MKAYCQLRSVHT